MAVNHFKEFETVAQYEAYIQPDDYAKPLVALVDETDTVMFPQGGGGGDCGNPILTSIDVDDYSGGTTFNGLAQITDVEFPAGITTIGSLSFDYCRSLTSVTIPSGVTSIEQSAFYGCTGLTSIVLPSTLTSIGTAAFRECSSLTSIDIPSSVTTITTNTFNGCSSLTSINIPGVTSINSTSFQSCSSLASVVFPSTLTSIGNSAFRNCSALLSVTCLATTPPTLGTAPFNGTHANMVIYVPAESVETYKTASGWSTYASRIQAIQ